MQLAILATAHLREQVVAFNARTGNGPEKRSEAVAGATRSWLRCSLERSIPECTRASRVPLLAGHDRGEATALPAAPAR
ncbi:MAG: hypothetical protein GY944_13260 [bacterium]|nr:hypothetical protein [bacterium]